MIKMNCHNFYFPRIWESGCVSVNYYSPPVIDHVTNIPPISISHNSNEGFVYISNQFELTVFIHRRRMKEFTLFF